MLQTESRPRTDSVEKLSGVS